MIIYIPTANDRCMLTCWFRVVWMKLKNVIKMYNQLNLGVTFYKQHRAWPGGMHEGCKGANTKLIAS